MADAAILIDGRVVKTTGMDGLSFNSKSGFLIKFTLGNKTYRHVYKSDFAKEDQNSKYSDAGYYEEKRFLEYLAKKIYDADLTAYKAPAFTNAVNQDKVKVRKLKVVPPYTDFCKTYDFFWKYNSTQKVLDDNQEIIIPAEHETTEANIPVIEIAHNFYDRTIALLNNSNLIAPAQKDSAAYVIARMALLIHYINTDIFSIIVNNPEFAQYIQSQNLEWGTQDLILPFNFEGLQSYNNQLQNFYNAAYSNKIRIQEASTETKLYWLAQSLTVNGLAVVPAYDKLKLLTLIAKGSILGETSKVLPQVNEEEFVLDILRSVNENQIQVNDFLDGLVNVNFGIIENKQTKTLFQLLYEKIDDFGLTIGGPGAENLKIFVNEIYRSWLVSKYCPYDLNGQLKPNFINKADYASKPISLDYEAGKFLWIFNDTNYNFRFNKGKIEVTEEQTETDLAYDSPHHIEIVAGSYNIYQTLTIVNTDSNTSTTKYLKINLNGREEAAIPLFYLKYIDDKKEVENIETGLSIAFDLALTISGIGNLAKLRHLRSLTAIGRVVLGLETAAGTELIAFELFQGVWAAVEISSSALDIWLRYIVDNEHTYCNTESPKYNQNDCQFYTELSNFNLVLQLVSGSLDFATSKQLSQSANKMLSGPLPNDIKPEVIQILQKFAGNLPEIKELFRVRLLQRFGDNSAFWLKINDADFAPRLAEFLTDFGKADVKVLEELNDNLDLIELWGDIEHFPIMRKEVEFLKTFRFIRNSDELNEEIFQGVVRKEPANQPGQFIWISKGVHHKDALDNALGGNGKIIGDKLNFPPPNSDYYVAKVEVYHPEFPSNNGFKVKKKKSTFFPDIWTKKRIQEELAFAYGRKTYKGGNLYKSKMSDGVSVTFHINNNIVASAYPSFN